MDEAVRNRKKKKKFEFLDNDVCRHLNNHNLCLENNVIHYCPRAGKIFTRLNLRDYFLSFILPNNDRLFSDDFLDDCQIYNFVASGQTSTSLGNFTAADSYTSVAQVPDLQAYSTVAVSDLSNESLLFSQISTTAYYYTSDLNYYGLESGQNLFETDEISYGNAVKSQERKYPPIKTSPPELPGQRTALTERKVLFTTVSVTSDLVPPDSPNLSASPTVPIWSGGNKPSRVITGQLVGDPKLNKKECKGDIKTKLNEFFTYNDVTRQKSNGYVKLKIEGSLTSPYKPTTIENAKEMSLEYTPATISSLRSQIIERETIKDRFVKADTEKTAASAPPSGGERTRLTSATQMPRDILETIKVTAVDNFTTMFKNLEKNEDASNKLLRVSGNSRGESFTTDYDVATNSKSVEKIEKKELTKVFKKLPQKNYTTNDDPTSLKTLEETSDRATNPTAALKNLSRGNTISSGISHDLPITNASEEIVERTTQYDKKIASFLDEDKRKQKPNTTVIPFSYIFTYQKSGFLLEVKETVAVSKADEGNSFEIDVKNINVTKLTSRTWDQRTRNKTQNKVKLHLQEFSGARRKEKTIEPLKNYLSAEGNCQTPNCRQQNTTDYANKSSEDQCCWGGHNFDASRNDIKISKVTVKASSKPDDRFRDKKYEKLRYEETRWPYFPTSLAATSNTPTSSLKNYHEGHNQSSQTLQVPDQSPKNYIRLKYGPKKVEGFWNYHSTEAVRTNRPPLARGRRVFIEPVRAWRKNPPGSSVAQHNYEAPIKRISSEGITVTEYWEKKKWEYKETVISLDFLDRKVPCPL
ncbi:unnamed protein product [Enterobius vermicularis]|uniref:BTB domain-containing protein n=1 Tax=Enterobius vermicularis TaxID=51028 RepID=A0A0N4VMY0_ENTVE|nr:unnamed protein product [Enterobius vermicularis]